MKHNRVSVRTFGKSTTEAGPLLFVETGRADRQDDAFILLCEASARGKRLFVEAITQYKRGKRIRTPDQYIVFLAKAASGAAPSAKENDARPTSFAAAWLRGGSHTWASAGSYSFLSVSSEGTLTDFEEASGAGRLEPGGRLIVGERQALARLKQRLSRPAASTPTPPGETVGTEAEVAAGAPELESILSSLTEEAGGTSLVLLEQELKAPEKSGDKESPAPRRVSATGAATRPTARIPAQASESAHGTLRSRRALRWALPVAGVALVVVLAAVIWPALRGAGPPRLEEISELPEPVAVPTGQARTRIAAETPGAVTFSSKWKKTLRGAVTSSPIVFEGKVYFGCRDGNLYCLNAETGEEIWKFPAGAGIGSSPVVSKGSVLVGAYSGRFWSLDAVSGKKNWEFKTGGRIVSSPSVASGRVVFGCYDRNLYCLSERDGKLRWKHEAAGLVWSSPCISKGKVFFGSADGSFYCLSLDSGKQHWREVTPEGVYSSPAVEDKVVCFGSVGRGIHFLDVSSGKELFRVEARREVRASPLLAGGAAYIGDDDGILRCILTAEETVGWTFKAGRGIRSRPFLSEGLLYVTSYDGRLYALDASSGDKVGSFSAGAEIYSSPAVWEEKVYFGTNNGDFYCIQQESPSP